MGPNRRVVDLLAPGGRFSCFSGWHAFCRTVCAKESPARPAGWRCLPNSVLSTPRAPARASSTARVADARPASGRPRRAPHLGRAGRATAAKVAFNDRDFSGAIASSHTGAGAGTWYPPNLNRQLCNSAGTSDPITKPGPDGINLFQGALAYDPVLRNWTAPDAYAGNVGDSMSQKAYMWNRNNSFEYSDPSGYDA